MVKKAEIIAEIGVNHEGSLDLAKEMVKSAFLGGADCVKFQTYKAESLAAEVSPSYWDLGKEPTKSQRQLFQRHECFNIDFYLPIIDLCKDLGIEFMTTCFDEELMDIFSGYVKRIKISSSDLTNIPLVRKAAKTNKDLILSCGASSLDEIQAMVNEIRRHSSAKITLLHCVLNYPCSPENANILLMKRIQSSMLGENIEVGYSCHVPLPESIDCMLAAWQSGAKIIEKHFTLCRGKTGNDHYHAAEWKDLIEYRQRERNVITILGNGQPDLNIQSSARKNARRGIYTRKDVKAGGRVSESELIMLRPECGISAVEVDHIVNGIWQKDLKSGSAVQKEDVST